MAHTLPTVELPSGAIEYASYGSAESSRPPVVFVHGAVVDHRLWEPVAQLLAERGHRCLVPLMPLGSHHIPWGPDADRSPRGAARLLREFVEHFDLGSATLVANDTGGAVTQFALDDDPEFVSRLVFTNCDAFDLFPPQPFRIFFAMMRHRLLLKPLVDSMRITMLRHSPVGVGLLLNDPDPDLTGSVFAPCRPMSASATTSGHSCARSDRRSSPRSPPACRASSCPCASCGAATTGVSPPHTADGSPRSFPAPSNGARFVEIGDARTFVSLDQPEAVAAEIAAFTADSSDVVDAPDSSARRD